MRKIEALELIANTRKLFGDRLEDLSRLNPAITIGQGLDIVEAAIDALPGDDTRLSDLIEKRVYQITRNQIRPQY